MPEPREMTWLESLAARHRRKLWLPRQQVTLTLGLPDGIATTHQIRYCPHTDENADNVARWQHAGEAE